MQFLGLFECLLKALTRDPIFYLLNVQVYLEVNALQLEWIDSVLKFGELIQFRMHGHKLKVFSTSQNLSFHVYIGFKQSYSMRLSSKNTSEKEQIGLRLLRVQISVYFCLL